MSQAYVDDCYASTHSIQTDMQNIENNFAALKSCFSGAAQPPNPVAGMWWYDTTANILKLRNEANNAWQSVWDFANNKPIVANNVSSDFSAALKDPVAGTAGLRTLGTGAQQACAGNDARLSNQRVPTDGSVTAAKLAANKTVQLSIPSSETPLQISSDTAKSTTNISYEMLKEIKIPKGGTLRIAFTLGSSSGRTGYGRIYRNWAAVGTERSVYGDNEVEFFEDISGWTENNLCQIYCRISHVGATVFLKNFRIYASDYQINLD